MDYYTFGELPDDTSNINLKNEILKKKIFYMVIRQSGADIIRDNFIK